jgi:hypothetical protein
MLYRPGLQGSRMPGGSAAAEHIDQVITNPGPLPFPTEAKLDATGEPVTLLQTCDWKGNSPANIGVDKRGKQFLATFDELTVTDHRIVPNPAVDAIRAGRQVT